MYITNGCIRWLVEETKQHGYHINTYYTIYKLCPKFQDILETRCMFCCIAKYASLLPEQTELPKHDGMYVCMYVCLLSNFNC